jgi:hypothetical protein
MSGQNKKTTKILTIIAFLCIALVLYIIAITPPANGYELSIYDAYPAYFWAFLIGSIACGITILVLHAFAEEHSHWWLTGLVAVIFYSFILISLRTFRGYPFANPADLNDHLSWMNEIANTGHIGETNYYPVLHLIAENLRQISGLSEELIADLLTTLFVILFILGIYILVSTATHSRMRALLATAFASMPLLGYSMLYCHPSGDSVLMIPLLLYFYHHRKKSSAQVEDSIALLILAFFITFFHPVTSLFLIAIFLAFGLASALYHIVQIYKGSNTIEIAELRENYLGTTLIICIAFFMWYFSYSAIQGCVRRTFNWLLYEIGTSTFQAHTEVLAEAGLTFYQTVELFVNRYGAISLYLLISTILVIFIFKQSISKSMPKPDAINFTYGVQFLVAILVSGLLLFGQHLETNIVRVLRLPVIIATILNGICIFTLISNSRRGMRKPLLVRKEVIGFIITILVVSSVMITLNFYNSPRICMQNYQVTVMELTGTEWLLDYQPKDIVTVRTYVPVDSYQKRFIPRSEMAEKGIRVNRHEDIPPHFGYDQYDTIAEAFIFKDRFAVTGKLEWIYPLIYPKNVRPNVIYTYTEDDFTKLNTDSTAAKLYANGEFWVWRVYPA